MIKHPESVEIHRSLSIGAVPGFWIVNKGTKLVRIKTGDRVLGFAEPGEHFLFPESVGIFEDVIVEELNNGV